MQVVGKGRRNMDYRRVIEKLNPIDDIFFRKMAENKSFCEEILREFLEDPGLEVLENHAQHSKSSVRKDVPVRPRPPV